MMKFNSFDERRRKSARTLNVICPRVSDVVLNLQKVIKSEQYNVIFNCNTRF